MSIIGILQSKATGQNVREVPVCSHTHCKTQSYFLTSGLGNRANKQNLRFFVSFRDDHADLNFSIKTISLWIPDPAFESACEADDKNHGFSHKNGAEEKRWEFSFLYHRFCVVTTRELYTGSYVQSGKIPHLSEYFVLMNDCTAQKCCLLINSVCYNSDPTELAENRSM